MGTFPAARQRVLCIAVCALFTLTTAPVPAQSDPISPASEILVVDTFVRSTFEQHRTDDYKQAATAYLDLIATASRMLDSEDPRPSTEENERVAEHLERVAVALERYGDESFPAGFDDRGMIYVRLGAPSRVARIRNEFMLTGGAAQMAFEFPDALTIPPNEFWTYADLTAASYLFIRERGSYRLSTPRELLAPSVRRGFSEWERGRARAELALGIVCGMTWRGEWWSVR